MNKYLVPSNDPILKQICEPVTAGENISEICDLMEKVCKRCRGIGLAAPQIGVAKRIIFVIYRDVNNAIRSRFMINPRIVKEFEGTSVQEEGCLSYPGVIKKIRRPIHIEVHFLDTKRIERKEVISYLHARVVCHEIDHLNGVCRVGDDSPPATEDITEKENDLSIQKVFISGSEVSSKF